MLRLTSEGAGRIVVAWGALAAVLMTTACRPKAPEQSAQSPTVRNMYQNEQEWIVATVARSVGAMARHACGVASNESALVRALPVEVGSPPRFAVDPSSPAAAWVRAIRLAATRDWRLLPNPEKASFLERFIQVRAIYDSFDGNRALDFLDDQPKEDWPDLGRHLPGRPGPARPPE